MKFVLNGGLIIGTCDGANIEVSRPAMAALWLLTNKNRTDH